MPPTVGEFSSNLVTWQVQRKFTNLTDHHIHHKETGSIYNDGPGRSSAWIQRSQRKKTIRWPSSGEKDADGILIFVSPHIAVHTALPYA
jgi:hypothetical protein